jgi:integrase
MRLARQAAPHAVRRLIERAEIDQVDDEGNLTALSAETDRRVVMVAANALIERAFGKPREYSAQAMTRSARCAASAKPMQPSSAIFRTDEARRLTNACPADFRALVAAALLTGCRYGELTEDDFNLDAGTIRVRTSKSGRPRHDVLTEEGRDFVIRLSVGKSGSARLFLRTNGEPWAKSEQQRPLAAACAAARIERVVNFHGLRHTYAIRLAMRSVPLAVIAAQSGHSDTRMVERHCGHLSPSYVADMIRAAFGSLGLVEPSNVAPLGASL